MNTDEPPGRPTPAEVSGSRIAGRRKALRLSQEALGGLVGSSQSAVADWEKGKTRPRPGVWPRLAEALDADLDHLFPDVTPSRRAAVMQGGYSAKIHEDQAFMLLFDGLNEAFTETQDRPPPPPRPSDMPVERVRELVMLTHMLWGRIVGGSTDKPLPERVDEQVRNYRAEREIAQRMQALEGTGKKDG